jgi:uncharacterized protein (DUF362 family)
MPLSLSRRALLRGLGVTAVTLLLPRRISVAGYRSHVAAGWVPAGEPDALKRTLRTVVEAATDFSWLVPGDRVLVKVASDSGSRFPATSSPAAIFTLVRHLYARGAGVVLVGDQSGARSRRRTRTLMRENGLWRAAEAAGATPVAFEELGHRVAAEADHIVYLPRVAHRDLAVPAIEAGLRLVVSDGTAVLTFGPFQTHVTRPATGLVFASTDLAGHELLALRWLAWSHAAAVHTASAHWARDEAMPTGMMRACRTHGGADVAVVEWVNEVPDQAGAAAFMAALEVTGRPSPAHAMSSRLVRAAPS